MLDNSQDVLKLEALVDMCQCNLHGAITDHQ